ncbi:MAG: RHS repeat protein, partial [Kiritimatiellae bacterium]|nr:RHS repeat protein [Kiritimatiellia bacterium]
DGCFTELVRVSTSSVNGVLGTIDTTVYPNDDYAVRVTAFDVNGQGRTEGVVISIQGQVKPGQFTLEITDISIPTRSLPIEIVRRYDSLKRDDLNAFGFGWALLAANPDLRESVRDETLPYSPFSLYPLYVGARVYLNDPDGYRVGFTFDAELERATFLEDLYFPRFEEDVGVFDGLEDNRTDIRVTLTDGEAFNPLVKLPYNPREYRLTRRDGSVYIYDQVLGLRQIMDRFSNTVTYSENAITHSDGTLITLQRDDLGRVATVSSTSGVLAAYTYDEAGNLASVTDAENLTTSYLYFDDPAHALRAIIGPDGRILHQAEFDEAGRMVRQSGGGDAGIERTFDPGSFTGINRDEFGRETLVTYDTNALVTRLDSFDGTVVDYTYDDRGRLAARTVDGVTATFAYDDGDQLLRYSNALGEVWSYTYGAYGIDSLTDPMGRTVTTTVSDQDRITSLQLPGGGLRLLQYDDQGRLTNRVDELGRAIAMTYDALTVPDEIRWDDGSRKQFTWGAAGRLETMTDEEGFLTFFEMNQAGAITQVVDHAGHVTTMSFDGRSRLVKTWTDADGETFTREDLLDADGIQTGIRYLFPNGETVTVDVVAGIPESITNVVGQGVSNLWAIGQAGSTTSVADAEGNSSEFVIRNELI